MNSRKVVFVPTLHSVFNHETKHNEVKPFSAEETETLLSFLRDPKALLTSGDTVDFSVPINVLTNETIAVTIRAIMIIITMSMIRMIMILISLIDLHIRMPKVNGKN
jgi:hypothetical protein